MICVPFFFKILPNRLPVSPPLELLDYSSYLTILVSGKYPGAQRASCFHNKPYFHIAKTFP